jgi:hypothetical protein
MSDFLAVTLIGAGSSWGRSPDKETAIQNCVEHLIEDWSALYLLQGMAKTVTVYNVEGHDEVWWDARDVYGKNPDAPKPEVVEYRKVDLGDYPPALRAFKRLKRRRT